MKTLREFLEESAPFVEIEEQIDELDGEDDEQLDLDDEDLEEEIDLDDFDEDEELEEDVEELEELSRKTMGSYIQKASREVDLKSYRAGYEGAKRPGSKAVADFRRKANNRRTGIARVGRRMMEDAVEQIDEGHDIELKRDPNGKHYTVHKIHPKSGIGSDQMKVGEELNDSHVDDLHDMGYKVKIHK